MKRRLFLTVVSVMILFLGPSLAVAGKIRATAIPAANAVLKGDRITVPVVIDVSRVPERLGSFTAKLTWNPKVLRFTGYSPGADSFTKPVVNVQKASLGSLTFAAVNPRGVDGRCEVLVASFEVIGSEATSSRLELEFTAMAAAYTFADLLPYVEIGTTGVEPIVSVKHVPKEFSLSQNHPNPFNESTEISYQLPKAVHVTLQICDPLGRGVRTLVDAFEKAGTYRVLWDGKDNSGKSVPADTYICKMKAGSFSASKKMLLVR